MTKKDFELIAAVLRAELARQEDDYRTMGERYRGIDELVNDFADALQHTNPRFDRARFVAAATGRESDA